MNVPTISVLGIVRGNLIPRISLWLIYRKARRNISLWGISNMFAAGHTDDSMSYKLSHECVARSP